MTEEELQRQRLAARLKEYRKRLGFSQKELADRLGKAQTVISSWEIGTGMPNANQITAIAKVLEVSVDDLIGTSNIKSEDAMLLDAYHKADKITQNNIKLLLGLKGE